MLYINHSGVYDIAQASFVQTMYMNTLSNSTLLVSGLLGICSVNTFVLSRL